jgi:MFS family permease
LYGDIASFGILNGIAATFLSVFALRMGASDQQVGLLTALPALIYVIWMIPAGRLVESRRNIRSVGVTGAVLFRAQYALIALIPFLPAPYRVPALLVVITLAAFPLCVANVAITNVLADVVPPANRPRVMSMRNVLVSITSALAAAGAGKLLDALPRPLNYQVIFLIAFGAGMLSAFFFSRLVVEPAQRVSRFSMQPRQFAEQVREIVAVSCSNPAFLRFTAAAFVLHWALVTPWPLFALWWVNGLKATEGLLGLIATVNLSMTILSNPVWGKIAERRGNRFVLMAGFAGVVFMPVVNALLPRPELLLITEGYAGLIVPALNLGLFNAMLESCPVARRPAYISFYSAAVNVPIFLGPLLATGIFAPIFGVRLALALSSGLRMVAWVVMFVLLRKATSPGDGLAER